MALQRMVFGGANHGYEEISLYCGNDCRELAMNQHGSGAVVQRSQTGRTPGTLAPAQRIRFKRLMWITMIVLCVIGAAAVIRRVTALANPPRNAPALLANLDAEFVEKRGLTLLDIIPGLILVTLVPFQFSRKFRSRHLRVHRWIGRTVII